MGAPVAADNSLNFVRVISGSQIVVRRFFTESNCLRYANVCQFPLFVIFRRSPQLCFLFVDLAQIFNRYSYPQFRLTTPVLEVRHGLGYWAAPLSLFVANVARIAGTIWITAPRVCLHCKRTAFRKKANRAQLRAFRVMNGRYDGSSIRQSLTAELIDTGQRLIDIIFRRRLA